MKSGTVPRLETARLLMRAFSNDDLNAYSSMNSDADTMRYLGGPATREEAWRMMAFTLGHWQLRGYGIWALEDRHTGEFIGRAGLFNQEGWPGVEAAWSITRSHWNRGFATEAGTATLDFAFNVHNFSQIISLIHPENAASRRVAEKLGMQFEATYPLLGVDHQKYVLQVHSWRSCRILPER